MNREGAGKKGEYDDAGGVHMFGRIGNFRDIVLLGESDKIVDALVGNLGWRSELNDSMDNYKKRISFPGSGKKSPSGRRQSSGNNATYSKKLSMSGGGAAIHLK